MSLPADPQTWCIGLVGYGEVGRILAEDLHAAGVRNLLAFDVKLETKEGAALRTHAQARGVRLAGSHAGLAAQADLIISAVTASQTVLVAELCAPQMRSAAWFLDLNSASPGAKIRAGQLVQADGGRYIEGAVMSSVPPHRIRVPLTLGGPHAAQFAPLINALGFAARAGSPQPGVASATKMCRSVIIKGLEALVIESFTTARAYGVEEAVLASLAETFPGIDWEKQGTYFYQRVFQHGRRRAEEMREVAQTVREIGLEPWLALSTAELQATVAGLAEAGRLGDGDAPAAHWRESADRVLNTLHAGS